MKKQVIAGLIALLVVGGGAGAYLMTKDKDDSKATDTNSSQSAADTADHSDNGDHTFNPKNTSDKSFIATLSGTSEGQGTINGTIESDGKGNFHFTGTSGDQLGEYFIMADGKYIICNDGTCYSVASTDEPDTNDYNVTDDDIEKFRSTASYQGTADCPAGTCDVWLVNDEGTETKIYISTKDQTVSQVEGSDDGSTFKVVYEFKDVTVTAPENVQEFSIPTTN